MAFKARSIIVWLGLAAPFAAMAQFSVVSQTASASVGSNASDGVNTNAVSEPRDLGSINLHVQTRADAAAGGDAAASTIAEAGRVGIGASAGGWASSQLVCTGAFDGCFYPSGWGQGQVTQYFDVTQLTDATVSLSRRYISPDPAQLKGYRAGGFGFPIFFEKQLSSGDWVGMDSPLQTSVLTNTLMATDVTGLLHLDPGHYRLQASIAGSMSTTQGFTGGSGSLTITAVPEPASLSMMALGVLGLGALARRRGHGAC